VTLPDSGSRRDAAESGAVLRRSRTCCRLAESSTGLRGPGTSRRVWCERRRRCVCRWFRGTSVRPSGRRDGARRRAARSGARPAPQGTAGVLRDLLAGRHGERSERHAEGGPPGGARARPSATREVSARTPRAYPLEISVFYVSGACRCARAVPEPCPSCARAVPEQGWRSGQQVGAVRRDDSVSESISGEPLQPVGPACLRARRFAQQIARADALASM